MTKLLDDRRAATADAEALAGLRLRAHDVEDVDFRETSRDAVGEVRAGAPGREGAAAPAKEPARRRIGLHHIAFFRAYLEGLDLSEQAERYLEIGRDARRAQKTVRWLTAELVAAARKRLDFGAARLLKIRPSLIRSTSPAAGAGENVPRRPTLEEFAEAHDPDGFYTERDLLALFAREYPEDGQSGEDAATARRQARNERLRRRQMAALYELERLLVEDPRPDHHVTGWFDTSVALRLADARLHTLGQLVDVINAIGYRWYRSVPKLGEQGAARIVAFLHASEAALGMAIAPAALERPSAYPVVVPGLTREPSTAMGPLELYVPAPEHDGSLGENRAQASRNKTGAFTDREAIYFWLRKYAQKPTTAEKYRNEAERLLLWANLEKNKPLSSLSILDCHEYLNVFLNNPHPAHTWVMERPFKRDDPRWRPFRGPLGYSSRESAMTSLKSLFSSLTNARYLDFNPLAEVRIATLDIEGANGSAARQTRTHRMQIERSLSQDEWRFVQRYLRKLPDDKPATHRMRFIVRFAYGTGLRRAELAGARTGDVAHRFAGAELGTITVLNVLGKGDVMRQIPLSPGLLKLLGDYLEQRGLSRDPARCPPDTPLIPALEDNRDKARRKAAEQALANAGVSEGEGSVAPPVKEKPITPDKLYEAIKRFFANAASAAAFEAPELGATFAAASTHWLRHTFGSHGVAGGMALATARNMLGHADMATTSLYSTAEIAQQYRELDAFLSEGLE
ncbi:phage integrase family protein [Paraburkholderia sp. SIMBA_054]|uniref:phage integrase family protein n=1 Tax=Paraburkholderia sp. SIMBA_054 TaxID=3085795 RepID=UPI00397AB913